MSDNQKMDMIYDLLLRLEQDIKHNHMPKSEIEERFRNQGERLGKVEQNLTWVTRTVVGAVILAVIGFFYTQGGK